jgi:glutathione S-transferase
MLTFYYHPLSPLSRRVWVALLEKEIPFEPVVIRLQDKQQFSPDFLALNPFHHVPVIVDKGICIIESIAILDYLELQYPNPALMPQSPAAIARVKMLQMVNINELVPKLTDFLSADRPVPETTLVQIKTVLTFFSKQLGQSPFFGGEVLSLADIVLGVTLSLMHRLGLSLEDYPAIEDWQSRLFARHSWQSTQPSDEDFERFRRYAQLQLARKSPRRNLKLDVKV